MANRAISLHTTDWKTLLQEKSQSKGIRPIYQTIAEIGFAHNRQFVSRVTVGRLSEIGSGPSKKNAEMSAAEEMLFCMEVWPDGRQRE